MRWVGYAMVMAAGVSLASCRFVRTSDVQALAASGLPQSAAPDPEKKAEADWGTKIVPYFEAKAGPYAAVRELAAKSPDEAGAKYGFRAKADGASWTLMARLEGVIVAADTDSRAATIAVDASGGGKADAIVQIGPALRGTAIRDALDFVAFGDFTNQIDFARFGKALNVLVNHLTLEKLPRDALIGRKVKLIGAFPLAADPPLITPVEIEIGAKP